ncbi:MAG: 4Fe-4S ferredoxin [Candidatus Wallbacteria bacterium HGW-Wallbacteria-1]|jgi:ferredoxin|uniref:4Fe-4S ferredoxin n=1 Tax=Candidatus Wallbacteria bacterium HGW-Wallbacteria-1 TaxID=2013854 RepID=A0A2N1PMD0_9BACT|nr:MAG: 4Fe-4S ferredoxin [Candidatus Wallbacteria bacterium HGW-Wallbacteria-1]
MKKYMKLMVHLVLVILPVLFFSETIFRLGGKKSDAAPGVVKIEAQADWTLSKFARTNRIPEDVLARLFPVRKMDDGSSVMIRERTLQDLMKMSSGAIAGPSDLESLRLRAARLLFMRAESGSKNWKKIVVKFICWAIFLGICLRLMMKGSMRTRLRSALYLGGVYLFGVVLGADPSPMGTVKDAIVLLGTQGIVFPPRMVAFLLFMTSVFIANKLICSWGCQLGMLQDMIFRINRDSEDKVARTVQYRLPFAFSNTIRILTFSAIVWWAFYKGVDIIEAIDPFRVFKPSTLQAGGALFLGSLILSSLFVYRPWCHLFCPFGLAGWIVEQFSFIRIRVNRNLCISCGSCEKSCPTNVMSSYMRDDRIKPDCFSCGTCIEVCPAGAVAFCRNSNESSTVIDPIDSTGDARKQGASGNVKMEK